MLIRSRSGRREPDSGDVPIERIGRPGCLVCAVTLAVISQMLPLIIVLGAIAIFAAILYYSSGDTSLVSVLSLFGYLAVFYGFIPFWVHEMGHLVALYVCRASSEISVVVSPLRVSLVELSPGNRRVQKLVAVAGPLSAALLSIPAFMAGDCVLAAAYGCHLLFLLPCFGDGRVLWGYHSDP